MHVKRTYEGRALSAIVIQTKELEAGIVFRAQIALDIVFIAECLQFSTCHKEFLSLRFHAVVTQQITEDLEVSGLVYSVILIYLLEIGECTPLTLFVGNDRTVIRFVTLVVSGEIHLLIMIVVRVRSMFVPVEASCPALYMKLRPFIPFPATSDGSATIDL